MNKKIGIAVGVIVLIWIIGAISNKGSPPSQTSPTATPKVDQKAEMMSKIVVTAETQDLRNEKGETKVVVKVTNNSDKTFSGTVKINSIDVDGSSIGYDGLSPQDIEPGKAAIGITWLKVAATPKFKTEVLSSTFK